MEAIEGVGGQNAGAVDGVSDLLVFFEHFSGEPCFGQTPGRVQATRSPTYNRDVEHVRSAARPGARSV